MVVSECGHAVSGTPLSYARPSSLAHVPAKWNPVRQGEPLFADKDMRQTWNLRRLLFILDH
jgi:hypothetical protein